MYDNMIPYKLEHTAFLNDNLTNLFVSLGGDSIRNIINTDSCLAYNLLAKNISIRSSKDKPIDIYLEKYINEKKNIPLTVIFYKNKSSIYLIIVSNLTSTHLLNIVELPFIKWSD